MFISDRFGCSYSGAETIPATAPFELDGYFDSTLVLGYSVAMSLTANFQIEQLNWTPIMGLACTNCAENTVRPFETMEYSIYAMSVVGCETTASFRIEVNDAVNAYVPNVFSPNFDGVNDMWGVSVDPVNVKSIDRVVVFDRWGGVIFTQNDIPVDGSAELWDGRVDGVSVNTGVYSYIVEVILVDDSKSALSGSITVVR